MSGAPFSCTGSGSGVLLALDENGNVLGQRKIDGQQKTGAIRIAITEDMPLGQTVQRVLQRGEEMLLQDEIILKHADWVAETYNRGHELANHSMLHPDMREATNLTIYKEITRCNELIEGVTGTPVTLYRPPSGYYTYRDRAIGRALGCEMILWTFDSLDGFYDSTRERIWNNMMKKSEPGAIILMHTYGRHTISILEEYIPAMQEQGYEFVTVTDLMLPGGVLDGEGVMRLPESTLP